MKIECRHAMTANDCCPGLANNWPTELQFKLTVYLQGCLAYKPCSVSGLNCKYLKPYIKLKLIGLAIRLYQQF